jgi:hypothetical protein
MISAVFLANPEGVVLIEKQYRKHVDRSRIDAALTAISNHIVPPPPIINNGDSTIVLHREDDIWVIGICDGDESLLFAVAVVQFVGRLLRQIAPRGCNEDAVKSEFPAIYQILAYAIDYGFPVLNEYNTIRTVITHPPSDPSRGLKTDLDFERPWRSVGIERILNAFDVNVVETIDLIVSPLGRIELCHIRGVINVRCTISGTPDFRVKLSDRPRFDDATFHRCVTTDTVDAKTIAFIPPDGLFTLMTYRVTVTQTEFPVWAVPKFAWVRGCLSFEITLKVQESPHTFVEELEVQFEVPNGVQDPTMTAYIGRTSYDIGTRIVVWAIGLYARKDPIVLKGTAMTDMGFEIGNKSPPVAVSFRSPGTTVSKLVIEDITIANETYQWTKSIEYVSRTGSYEFRTIAS